MVNGKNRIKLLYNKFQKYDCIKNEIILHEKLSEISE